MKQLVISMNRRHTSPKRESGNSPRPSLALRAGVRLPQTCALLALTFFVTMNTCPAASRDAYEKVRRGVRQFEADDFEAAADSFDEALSASPDDLRIVYNQACAAQARNELDEAVELFQKAAVADDPRWASACRYNLGVIAAERARTTFGEKPEEADEETRAEGLEHLELAVARYRDCLELDPEHERARHNLEVIRLWIKQMEQVWRERDRQRAREQMDLMKFLRFIDAQQRGLRSTTRSLGRLPDSPRRRHASRKTATSQRELTEEIEPLKRKIEEAIDTALKAAAGDGSDPPDEEQREQQLKPLLDLADRAGREMKSAAHGLDHQQLSDAHQAETDAIHTLDELFLALTDFPQLLERSIEEQQTLVDRVTPAVDNPEAELLLDGTDTAWRQRFVEDWAQMLQVKASTSLPRLEQMLSAAQAQAPNADGNASDQPDPRAAAVKQLGALQESMEKAVELCPRVATLAAEAADLLEDRNPGDALPKQEEALKLLREIAEPLREQQQEQQDQDKQDQDEKQDQQNDQQQRKAGQEQEKKEQEQQRQGTQQNEKQTQLSEKQIQALLQNVRERTRKRDEALKQMRAIIGGRADVEKDW